MILLAAKAMDVNGSSEGICTAKFLKALTEARLPVSVLTSDERITAADLRRDLPWVAEETLSHFTSFPKRRTRAAPDGGWSIEERCWTAVDLAASMARGYPMWYLQSIFRWRRALRSAIASARPAVIVTRGAGGGFEPHLAMLGIDRDVPWVAHYHDPWPPTLFPQPYTAHTTRPFRLQEHDHERVLEQADALTFPSARLRDWMLDSRPDLAHKAHVVPHAMGTIVNISAGVEPSTGPLCERPFTLVHTGTLLGHRRIEPLLDALSAFLEGRPDRECVTRLVLAGSIARPGGGDPDLSTRFAAYESRGVLRVLSDRQPYAAALALVSNAQVAILIEADGPSSPFFPAKLTDYANLDKPVLALTPRESVASDLMGADNALRVDPSDVAAIHRALDTLWDAFCAGNLDAFRLPPERLAPLRMPQVALAFRGVLEAAGQPI